MIPEKSELYSYSTKIINASSPRFPGSVILTKPSTNPDDYILKLAYRKYLTKLKINPNKPKINLLFLHGNGMNKAIWHYHIDKLYQSIENLNVVLALDYTNHAESASLNKGKLGYKFSWIDASKDVIKLIKENESDVFLVPNVLNLCIGHSMGGQISLTTAYNEPLIFDAMMVINPVCYVDDNRQDTFKVAFQFWEKRGYIKSEFELDNEESYQDVIYNFHKQKSFFKRFNDTVLRNMTEDELCNNETFHQGTKLISKNTNKYQEFITYFGGEYANQRLVTFMKDIEVPIYHICSENDILAGIPCEVTRERLKKVIHPTDIPNTAHLVNGENPDLIIPLITNMISERLKILSEKGDIRFRDESYLKQFGPNYREDLIFQEFKVNTDYDENSKL